MSLTERIQSLGRGIQLILDPSYSKAIDNEIIEGASAQLVQAIELVLYPSQPIREETDIKSIIEKFYELKHSIQGKIRRITSYANIEECLRNYPENKILTKFWVLDILEEHLKMKYPSYKFQNAS